MLIPYNVYEQLIPLVNGQFFKNQAEVEAHINKIFLYVALENMDLVEFIETVLYPTINKHRARKQIRKVLNYMLKDIMQYV